MIQWLPELLSALADEFADGPTIVALASSDDVGEPFVRFVVVRAVDVNGSAWITTDARSAKAAQLRERPSAELAFWLPTRREQYRMAGRVSFLGDGDKERRAVWESLSDDSRLTFFGPAPESTDGVEDFEYPSRVTAEADPPPWFDVVLLVPEHVERLELAAQPHRRVRWMSARGWAAERIAP